MKYMDDYSFSDQFYICYDYAMGLDWERIATRVKHEKVISLNISSSIDLFPHLTLDIDYELYAYICKEYHGLWGRVAAVKKGEPIHATYIELPWGSLKGTFELPETAVHPLAVIYADGSPHGYLDAIIAENFFKALPYTQHENRVWGICLCEQPEDYPDRWNILVDVPDWRPRLKQFKDTTTILLCWGKNNSKFGLGSEIEITLKEFIFYNSVFDNSVQLRKYQYGMYRAHISDAHRYREGQHCCLFVESSNLIATKG